MENKKKKIDAIYKATFKDYKLIVNGKKSILILSPNGGTALIPIEMLSDAEIEKRYKETLKK